MPYNYVTFPIGYSNEHRSQIALKLYVGYFRSFYFINWWPKVYRLNNGASAQFIIPHFVIDELSQLFIHYFLAQLIYLVIHSPVWAFKETPFNLGGKAWNPNTRISRPKVETNLGFGLLLKVLKLPYDTVHCYLRLRVLSAHRFGKSQKNDSFKSKLIFFFGLDLHSTLPTIGMSNCYVTQND